MNWRERKRERERERERVSEGVGGWGCKDISIMVVRVTTGGGGKKVYEILTCRGREGVLGLGWWGDYGGWGRGI